MAKETDHFRVVLPSMGEGVIEATVNKWLKSVGDEVKKDEPLLEVSTDKVDTEIMSAYSGFLIGTFVKEGEVVRVDSLLAQISSVKEAKLVLTKEEVSSSVAPTQAKGEVARKEQERVKSSSPRSSLQTLAGPIKSSPLVRRMARDLNVNLADVTGSGSFGRITKNDLLWHLDENSPSASNSQQEEKTKGLITETKDNQEFLEGVLVKREAMTKVRKLTALHMLESVKTSPHVTTTFEVNLEKALQFKKDKSDFYQKEHGVKLTLTPLFIASCVEGLKEHPYVNSSVDGFDILLKEDINIACAVATKEGLLVPVLKKLQKKSFPEVVLSFQDLVLRAREKKLQASDLKGGTFSVTNPGMYGSLHSQPIINQPQVAILSVGAITERCVLFEGKVVNQSFCQIGLTFDHRVIDGQGAALFLQVVKKSLESFSV